MKKRYFFCHVSEIQDQVFLIREVANKSVGAIRLHGNIRLLLNYCPHAGAPICKGALVPALLCNTDRTHVLDTQSPQLRCPWHGWEFDLESGRPAFESKIRLAFLAHEQEGEEVFVWIH
jgi:nitrite reductase/ring-hydroxylating ferredoxin subunit